jgi:hypothetical protein
MLWLSGNDRMSQHEGTQHFGSGFTYRSKEQRQLQSETAELVNKLVDGGYFLWRKLERTFEDAQAEIPEEMLSRQTARKVPQTRLSPQAEGFYIGSGRYLGGRRSTDLARLDDFLNSKPSGYLLVTGEAGMGKSTLLAHWARSRQDDCFIANHFFSQERRLAEVTQSLSHIAEDLKRFLNRGEGFVDHTDLSRIKSTIRDSLLQEQPHEKVILLLDGLDEAQDTMIRGDFPPLNYMLPSDLPTGTYVILSARTRSEEATKEFYASKLDIEPDQIEELRLEALDEQDVIDLLQHNPRFKALRQLAYETEFCHKVAERTSGNPLFLRHLLDELARKVNGHQINTLEVSKWVESMPDSLVTYLEEALKDVKTSQVLRYLAAAEDFLSRKDLCTLLHIEADRLKSEFIPWEVDRWLLWEGRNYCAFNHSLVGEVYRRWLSDSASERLEELKAKLSDYCRSHWQESQFAGRNLARLLLEIGQSIEMEELARNQEFLERQELLGPMYPANTLEMALRSALDRDDLPGTVEFSFRRMRWLDRKYQENPLDALRRNDLQRAQELADLQEHDGANNGPFRRNLWYLLVAHYLLRNGQREDALEMARRWLQLRKRLKRTTYAESEAFLTSQIYILDPYIGEVALDGLESDADALSLVVLSLHLAGRLEGALRVIDTKLLSESYRRSVKLSLFTGCEVVSILLASGQDERALDFMMETLERYEIWPWKDGIDKAEWIRSIHQNGYSVDSFFHDRPISMPYGSFRDEVTYWIDLLISFGKLEAAEAFREASDLDYWGPIFRSSSPLKDTVYDALNDVGSDTDVNHRGQAVEKALEVAGRHHPESEPWEVRQEIVQALTAKGLIEEAWKEAQSLEEPHKGPEMYHIVVRVAEWDQRQAFELACSMSDDSPYAKWIALQNISGWAFLCGDWELARNVAETLTLLISSVGSLKIDELPGAWGRALDGPKFEMWMERALVQRAKHGPKGLEPIPGRQLLLRLAQEMALAGSPKIGVVEFLGNLLCRVEGEVVGEEYSRLLSFHWDSADHLLEGGELVPGLCLPSPALTRKLIARAANAIASGGKTADLIEALRDAGPPDRFNSEINVKVFESTYAPILTEDMYETIISEYYSWLEKTCQYELPAYPQFQGLVSEYTSTEQLKRYSNLDHRDLFLTELLHALVKNGLYSGAHETLMSLISQNGESGKITDASVASVALALARSGDRKFAEVVTLLKSDQKNNAIVFPAVDDDWLDSEYGKEFADFWAQYGVEFENKDKVFQRSLEEFEMASRAIFLAAVGEFDQALAKLRVQITGPVRESEPDELLEWLEWALQRHSISGFPGAATIIALLMLEKDEYTRARDLLTRISYVAKDQPSKIPVARAGDLIKGLLETGQEELAIDVLAKFVGECRGATEFLEEWVGIFRDAALLSRALDRIRAEAYYEMGTISEAAFPMKYQILQASTNRKALQSLLPSVIASFRPDVRSLGATLKVISEQLSVDEWLHLIETTNESNGQNYRSGTGANSYNSLADNILERIEETVTWPIIRKIEEEHLATREHGTREAELGRQQVQKLKADYQVFQEWLSGSLQAISDEFEREAVLVGFIPRIEELLTGLVIDSGIDVHACGDWLSKEVFAKEWSSFADQTKEYLANAEAIWRLGERLSEWGGVTIYLGRALELELHDHFLDPLLNHLNSTNYTRPLMAETLRGRRYPLEYRRNDIRTLGGIQALLWATSQADRPNSVVHDFISSEFPLAEGFLLDDLPRALEHPRELRNHAGHPGIISAGEAEQVREEFYNLLKSIVRELAGHNESNPFV